MKRSSLLSGVSVGLPAQHKSFSSMTNLKHSHAQRNLLRERTITSKHPQIARMQLERIENGLQPDLIFFCMDPAEDDFKTIQACRRIRRRQKLVVISPVNDVSTVVRAVRMGALDYISHPIEETEFLAIAQRFLITNGSGTAAPAQQTQEHFEEVESDIFFLAASPAMQKIRAQVAQVAKVDMPVLLLGESGSGKEVLARLIHKLSRRTGKPMMKVNCAALPLDLLESELFGFETGAFTGATRFQARPAGAMR